MRSIGIIAGYAGDDDADASAEVGCRELGQADWLPAHPLCMDRDGSEGRGSIVQLEPDTEYEVQVLCSDDDGVYGTNPVRGTCRHGAKPFRPPAAKTTT